MTKKKTQHSKKFKFHKFIGKNMMASLYITLLLES